MNVMPLDDTPTTCSFYFPTVSNNNMVDAGICELEVTLEPLSLEY